MNKVIDVLYFYWPRSAMAMVKSWNDGGWNDLMIKQREWRKIAYTRI